MTAKIFFKMQAITLYICKYIFIMFVLENTVYDSNLFYLYEAWSLRVIYLGELG